MALEELRGWREEEQEQLQRCQDMLRALQQGEITVEEYDQHKRKLILALSKPVLGSHHAASAPSRLALLAELKNSGCILEIEYQWARVPIVCQIDLAKRPRKENREPACEEWASPHGGVPPDPGRGTAKAPRGKRPPHHGIRCSTSPAPPLGPSKYGPNIEKSPEHPLAPGTKQAFLLRQAALSGEGSELTKGKRLKRQPSFAGLGHARRSASFSAGESSASEASSYKAFPKTKLRSSLSFGSGPAPDVQRGRFARSLSFSGRSSAAAGPGFPLPPQENTFLSKPAGLPCTAGQGNSNPFSHSRSGDFGSLGTPDDAHDHPPKNSLRLPPLSHKRMHTRRPTLFEAATGLVRKPKESVLCEESITDSETGASQKIFPASARSWQVPSPFDGSAPLQAGVESEPEASKPRLGIWPSRLVKGEGVGCGLGADASESHVGTRREGGVMIGRRVHNTRAMGRDKGRGDSQECSTRGTEGETKEVTRGSSRGPAWQTECSSFEEGRQSGTETSATERASEKDTGGVHRAAAKVTRSQKARSSSFYSADSGFESADGSHDDLPRIRTGLERERSVGKVARQLLGNGHVLLKDWNRKGLKLMGLVKNKHERKWPGMSGAATDEEKGVTDIATRIQGCQIEDPSTSGRHGLERGFASKALKRRVHSTLDAWRHEACGPQPPGQFLTDEQVKALSELLPESLDELSPLLRRSWIHRYGPYVLTIVRDALGTPQLPATQTVVLTSAPSAGPPRRQPPPLPSSVSSRNSPSETEQSVTCQSNVSGKSYGTWARKGARGSKPPCNVEETCLPGVTAESDEDLDVFSPGVGSLPLERVGNPRAGHANRKNYLRRSQEKVLRRSLDNLA